MNFHFKSLLWICINSLKTSFLKIIWLCDDQSDKITGNQIIYFWFFYAYNLKFNLLKYFSMQPLVNCQYGVLGVLSLGHKGDLIEAAWWKVVYLISNPIIGEAFLGLNCAKKIGCKDVILELDSLPAVPGFNHTWRDNALDHQCLHL